LTKLCKAAAKSTALHTSTAAAAGLGKGARSGSPQLPQPPPSLPPHLHPSNTFHPATRGTRMSHRVTPSRPRLLHGRGTRAKPSPGRDGGRYTSHWNQPAPPPQTRRRVRRPAGACEGECTWCGKRATTRQITAAL
jgi:hypothetical protein